VITPAEKIENPNSSTHERQRQVVVVGGGTAGWVAALAAARNGADVFVIERRQHFGGNLSSGLPILGFFNVQSQQIVKGIADELVQRLLPLRGTDGYQLYDLWASSMVALEPIIVKSVIQQMLEEAGVNFLFAAQVTDVVVEDKRLAGLVVQKKSGRELVKADVYIDATGDAELACLAGAPVRLGAEGSGAMQPATLLFRLLNIDVRALRDHLKRHPDDYVDWRMKPGTRITAEFLESVPIGLAFTRFLDQARENGDYDATIDRVMWAMFPNDRSMLVNMLRPFDVDGTRSESITDGLRQMRPEVLKLEAFFRKYIPGCHNAYAVDVDPELLLRETRRIEGEYVLTAQDVFDGRQFDDSIGLGGYYVDVHNPGDPGCACVLSEGTYGIPYRCLLPKGIDNLLVAGRCISGTQEAAGSFRVMATCMAIGEGAGTAAALAVKIGATPRAIDREILRRKLIAGGALVEWPVRP
jgi:hypothetical protein